MAAGVAVGRGGGRGPRHPDPREPEPGRLLPAGLLAAARLPAAQRHHRQQGHRGRDPVQSGPAWHQVRVLALLLELYSQRLAHLDSLHHHSTGPAYQFVSKCTQR